MRGTFLGPVRGVALVLLAMLAGVAFAAETTDRVVAIEGQVERASGPADLLGLAADEAVTVRTLRAFGRLPQPFMELALTLRRDGIDLLAMGPRELRELLGSARAGEARIDPERVVELLGLIEDHGYLDWEPLAEGDTLILSDQDLLRGDGRMTIERESGETVTLRTSGLVLPAGAAREVDRRLWSHVPGVRLYTAMPGARTIPVQRWENLATVAPTPDGGHLVAGSVAGAGGFEVRLLRYGADGELQWVRRFGGSGYDWLVRGAAVGRDGRIVLAGEHGRHERGFVMALGPDGSVMWVRTLEGHLTADEQGSISEGVHDIAVNDAGDIVVVGWRRSGADRTMQGRLTALYDEGGTLQHKVIDAASELRVVVPLESGWLIGGTAADDHDRSWIARLDQHGSMQWVEDRSAGLRPPVKAAVRRGDGAVLAGPGVSVGAVTLRELSGDGSESFFREVAIRQDGYPIASSIGAFSMDADGRYFLAGQALDGHAWAARLEPEGALDWLQEYGRDGKLSLSGLLPMADRFLAVGTHLPDSARVGEHALWLLTADGEGVPLAAPALAEQSAGLLALLDSWLEMGQEEGALSLGGDAEFITREDGGVQVQLPFLALEVPWSFPGLGTRDGDLDLGLVRVNVIPAQGQDRWILRLELPSQLVVRHPRVGHVIGHIETAGKPLEALWAGDLMTVLQAQLDFGAVTFTVGPDDALVQHASSLSPETGYAWRGFRNELGRLSADRVRVHLDLEEGRPGVVSGPLVLEATGLTPFTRGGQSLGEMQRVFLEADYREVDLGVFGELAALAGDPERAMEIGPEVLLDQGLAALGAFEIRMGLTGLDLAPEPGADYRMGLAQATFGTAFEPAAIGQPERNLRTWFEAQSGYVGEESSGLDLQLESLRAGFSLEGISPHGILMLGMNSMMQGGLDRSAARGSLGEILSGLRLEVNVGEVRGRAPGDADDLEAMLVNALDLEVFDFNLRLDGLNTAAPDFGFRYRHRVDGQLPPGLLPVDERLLPREVAVDIAGMGLPVVLVQDDEVLEQLQFGGGDPLMALAQILGEHQSRLEIRETVIDLPLGGLRGTAEAGTREQDGLEILWSEANIVIRNLDALGDAFLAMVPSGADRQEALGVLTILKLAGERQQNADGETEHVFRIRADSAGEISVNGTDLGQLLSGGAAW